MERLIYLGQDGKLHLLAELPEGGFELLDAVDLLAKDPAQAEMDFHLDRDENEPTPEELNELDQAESEEELRKEQEEE